MNTETTITALEEAKNLILSMKDEERDLVAMLEKAASLLPEGEDREYFTKSLKWYEKSTPPLVRDVEKNRLRDDLLYLQQKEKAMSHREYSMVKLIRTAVKYMPEGEEKAKVEHALDWYE